MLIRRACAGLLVWLASLAPSQLRACLLDVWLNDSTPDIRYVFPNWQQVEIVDFGLSFCDSTTCAGYSDGDITGLTILNYGTAVGGAGGDISNLYLCFGCGGSGGACTPAYTMTYAGVWNVGGYSYAAWTWVPAPPPLVLSGDPCATTGPGGCDCWYVLRVFADITGCPTNLRTVRLGPGFNESLNPGNPGGISDQYECMAPWGEVLDPIDKTIEYAVKVADQDSVSPGDTITYTIYYGKPGTANLSGITVFDSLPPFAHYVAGSGTPVPDPGWDPDPGPPQRLRWGFSGPIPVAGGPTSAIRFSVSVDWGNGESFEPGSGDTAASEGFAMRNQAQVEFGSDCAVKTVVTDPTRTTVQRFLFWKLGDNDMLFAPALGQPPDEMVYSIFVKNLSVQKTWWNVKIWDTVPGLLDAWGADCGFDDPCTGWTMTPSGCAQANPGRVGAGATTILTWSLDMPPGSTMTVRWKAKLRGSTSAGATAINNVSILAWGRAGVVGGTGNSGLPRVFTHIAPVILATTYISYVGVAGSEGAPRQFVVFFPLNKKTQFELRGLQYNGAGFPTLGGVSASIGCLVGDCLTGFPGNGGSCPAGAIGGGGIAGCGAERTPAQYAPPSGGTIPYDYLYKLLSNSPVVWQLLTDVSADNQDNHTFAPASSMTYTGLMHYMWRRTSATQSPGYGESLSLINTSMDPYGTYNPGLSTTVHLFKFDYGNLAWTYVRTYEIAPESQAYDMGTLTADAGPWRTVSSDANLIVNQAMNTATTLPCCCVSCADNHGAFMPTRETGNVVSQVGSGTFYGLVVGYSLTPPYGTKVTVGNTGAVAAAYEVWRYVPDHAVQTGMIPANLNGTSGGWGFVAADVVPPGLAAPGNPVIYGPPGGAFDASSTSLYRIKLLSGGPIQVYHGARIYASNSGGAVMHAADGNRTGTQFWLNQTLGSSYTCGSGASPGYTRVMVVNVFCPKGSMAIRAVSEDGYSATFTTTGPDQCVAFTTFTQPAAGNKRNYTFSVLPGPSSGNVMAQFIQCVSAEKGYTAPFMTAGTHYMIVAPPVAYIGQACWITIVVVDETNVTKTDYCGTTSFTSTDPGAKIEGTPMDAYNFTWSSTPGSCDINGPSPNEDGVRLFINLVFTAIGDQAVAAADAADGSIGGLAAVLVVGADVKLSKEPRLAVAASGDTVRFHVCWSNYSSASAFTFVITDAVPLGTSFVPEASPAGFDCGNTDGVAVTTAYSTTASAVPPASFTTANPVTGTQWLRWTVPVSGVQTTGCACFRVTVN